jgi:hypothetical protein
VPGVAVPLAAFSDTLLFLHVLTGFMLVATIVIFTGIGLGLATTPRVLGVANLLWAVGGLGSLLLGIWLAIDLSAYQPWDGWVIGAIVLWALATETGRRAQMGFDAAESAPESGALAPPQNAMLMHWVRTGLVLALLIVMIYRPGA